MQQEKCISYPFDAESSTKTTKKMTIGWTMRWFITDETSEMLFRLYIPTYWHNNRLVKGKELYFYVGHRDICLVLVVMMKTSLESCSRESVRLLLSKTSGGENEGINDTEINLNLDVHAVTLWRHYVGAKLMSTRKVFQTLISISTVLCLEFLHHSDVQIANAINHCIT